MQTNAEKIQSSKELNKLLRFTQIKELNGKDFALQIKRSLEYYKASENYSLQCVKDEMKKLNIVYKDKYDYFFREFGTKRSQTAKMIRLGKLDNAKVSEYIEKYKDKCTIDGLDDFSKGKDTEAEMNTTTTKPKETSVTKKPLKYKTAKAGIDITIHDGVIEADYREAIKHLQSFLPKKATKKSTK